MTDDRELDLASIDPPIWRAIIKGTVYGPYTFGQFQSFVRDGRIAPKTLVSQDESAPFVPAEDVEALADAFKNRQDRRMVRDRRQTASSETTTANYIIVVQINGSGDNAVISTLNAMGEFGEVMGGVYVLRSQLKAGEIQKRLQQKLDSLDQLLIIDASRDRLAWSNLGPEVDVTLRSIWNNNRRADAA